MTSNSLLKSQMGPPYLTFRCSDPISSVVICGTLCDLSHISYSKLSPFLSTIFSEDEWLEAIMTLTQCTMNHLFCKLHKILILLIPRESSRHNSPSRPHYLFEQLALTSKVFHSGCLNIVLVTSKAYSYPLCTALSKAFSIFSMKTPQISFNVSIDFCLTEDDRHMTLEDRSCLTILSDGIRRAQFIVDNPTNMMDTDGFLVQILQVMYCFLCIYRSVRFVCQFFVSHFDNYTIVYGRYFSLRSRLGKDFLPAITALRDNVFGGNALRSSKVRKIQERFRLYF